MWNCLAPNCTFPSYALLMKARPRGFLFNEKIFFHMIFVQEQKKNVPWIWPLGEWTVFLICSSLASRIGESVACIPQKSRHQIVINGQQSNDGLLKYIGNQFHLYLTKEISKNWTLEKLAGETEQEITVSQNMWSSVGHIF